MSNNKEPPMIAQSRYGPEIVYITFSDPIDHHNSSLHLTKKDAEVLKNRIEYYLKLKGNT